MDCLSTYDLLLPPGIKGLWRKKSIFCVFGTKRFLWHLLLVSEGKSMKERYEELIWIWDFHFLHCVKNLPIRSYSGPYFSCIFLHSGGIRRDTSISPYSVRMWENVGKMQTRITPNTDAFYAVLSEYIFLKIVKTSTSVCL